MAVVTQRGVLPPGSTVGGSGPRTARRRRPRMGRRRADPVACSPGIGIDKLGLGRRRGRAVRWRAPPGRAGGGARSGSRPAGARRAHQPPRRRGCAVARRAPDLPAQRPRRRHPRSLVPRHRRHPHLGGGGRQGRKLRGWLQRLDLRARRAVAPGRRRRGTAPEPRAQGTGLAASRPAGPYVEADATASRRPRR